MKFKPIVIGLAVSLLLPLVGANARSISDPGRNLSGSSADLLGGVVQTDENFRRNKGSSKGSKGSKCSKSPSKPGKGSKCSK
jgi:hypothetical protein